MSNKTVKQGQSFIDKVTQLTGSIDNALKEAILNGVSITADMAIGIDIRTSGITNKRVAGFFNAFNEPATALSSFQIDEIENVGIGAMIIEDNFIVG